MSKLHTNLVGRACNLFHKVRDGNAIATTCHHCHIAAVFLSDVGLQIVAVNKKGFLLQADIEDIVLLQRKSDEDPTVIPLATPAEDKTDE